MNLICNIAGARPNFMKMAPVILEGKRRGLKQAARRIVDVIEQWQNP